MMTSISRRFMLLGIAMLGSSFASAGVLIEFFKDADFRGSRRIGDVAHPAECTNLRERFDNETSSLRWMATPTVKYTHDDWLVFYDARDCGFGDRFHVFANESDYYRDLADYYFDNKISSYQYLVIKL
jgi:hypothetical protein